MLSPDMRQQFIIPWLLAIFHSGLSQLNAANSPNQAQPYPGLDPFHYNLLQNQLQNQAQLNNALLNHHHHHNLLPNAAQNLVPPPFPGFTSTRGAQQVNIAPPPPPLAPSPSAADLFPVLPAFPGTPLFDPLMGAPLPDLTAQQVAFNQAMLRPTAAGLGLQPLQPPIRAAATTLNLPTSTIATPRTTTEEIPEKQGDSEQVRLIRRLLEETLAKQREERAERDEKTTSPTIVSTTLATTTGTTTMGPRNASIDAFSVFDKLNLSENEKKAIVSRVEDLLRSEIARKLKSGGHGSHGISKATPTSKEETKKEEKRLSVEFSEDGVVEEIKEVEEKKTDEIIPSTTTSTVPPTTTATVPPATSTFGPEPKPIEVPPVTSAIEKTTLKSLELKQKKLPATESLRRAPDVPTISESIDEVPRFRVNSFHKEIRDSQPNTPNRFYTGHKEPQELGGDLDLIALPTLPPLQHTADRRIAFPHDYEDRPITEPLRPQSYSGQFIQPVTGAPLDLDSDLYDEDEEGLVDLDRSRRREEEDRRSTSLPVAETAGLASLPGFNSERTVSSGVSLKSGVGRRRSSEAEEAEIVRATTSGPIVERSKEDEDLAPIETITTPPFKGRQHYQKPTQFELLASDFESRLAQTENLQLFLKKFYENAYIALIEREEGRVRYRHQSKPTRRI